jgi:hypothetical protein
VPSLGALRATLAQLEGEVLLHICWPCDLDDVQAARQPHLELLATRHPSHLGAGQAHLTCEKGKMGAKQAHLSCDTTQRRQLRAGTMDLGWMRIVAEEATTLESVGGGALAAHEHLRHMQARAACECACVRFSCAIHRWAQLD